MKFICLALFIIAASASSIINPYNEMVAIPHCVATMNNASTYCQTIWPKQDQYFERYYACFQSAATQLPFNCSVAYCEAERLDNFGVKCNQTYSFSNTVFNYTRKTPNIILSSACKEAIVPAITTCNQQFNDYTIADYYQKYYSCVFNQPEVVNVTGCAKNYCLLEGLNSYVDCDQISQQTIDFTVRHRIDTDCFNQLNATAPSCNKLPTNITNYYEYYYQCFQRNINDFACTQAFCYEYQLNYEGVDCNKTYNMTPFNVLPQNVTGQPACVTQNLAGCYPAISDAVKTCNNSIPSNTSNYYTVFYDCIQNNTEVAAVKGCAECYCEQAEFYYLAPGSCPVPNNTNHSVEMTAFNVPPNYSIFQFSTFNFSGDFTMECAMKMNNSAARCLSMDKSLPNYNENLYACFQDGINDQKCSEILCDALNLNKMGVNCSATYEIKKPVAKNSTQANKTHPTCFTQNIPGCYEAVSEAVTVCNKSVNGNSSNYYGDFYDCIAHQSNVSKIKNCAQCYCQQAQLYAFAPATCPVPTQLMNNKTTISDEVAQFNVNATYEIFEFPTFNFSNTIDPNCYSMINQTAQKCDQLNPNIESYYEYYYECFQMGLQNQPCAEAFCYEFNLDKAGINCSQQYLMPEQPKMRPQPKFNQPKCSTMNITGCYKAISGAVDECNKSVSSNSTDSYYDAFYSCVQNQKNVSSIQNCATCYCESIQLDHLILAGKC